MTALVVRTGTRHSVVTATEFAARFDRAREGSELIAAMTSPYEHTVRARHFLADDGQSGYVIRASGELTNVFSTVKGRGESIMLDAIADGATHLDCFDGYLPNLYARFGFVEYGREANWTPGAPDVVFMRKAA